MLPPQIEARTAAADKGFDAAGRVVEPLLRAGKHVVVPPQSNRKQKRSCDKELHKAGHPI